MSAEIITFKPAVRYWVCCGSTEPMNHDKRCREHLLGYPERRHWGTVKEHDEWLNKQYMELI